MLRFISISLLAASLCTLQSGCCCCRLPFAIRGGGPPIVFQPPPVVVQQPPPVVVQPPPDIQIDKDINPPKDIGNPPKDLGIPGKDLAVGGKEQKEYVYSQSTGQLKLGNQLVGTGYSGKGAGKNNPV